MLDTEWRLTYPGCDFTFGSATQAVFNRSTPDLGDYEVRSADAARPRLDGKDFGVDYFGSRTISFDLGVGKAGSSEATVRAAAASLANAWRADPVRFTPGAVAALRSRYRGVERVVYGRPRRIAVNWSGAATQRFVSATADFECADTVWYDVNWGTANVTLAPPTSGGLVTPLRSPLATTADSDRSTSLVVFSDLPVWPVITISGGQVTNPTIEVKGRWRLQLATTIAFDRTVTIDTRPWSRSVVIDGGGSLAGTLSRESVRLRNAWIPPGTFEVSFGGRSDSNTATASLTWQGVYPTL